MTEREKQREGESKREKETERKRCAIIHMQKSSLSKQENILTYYEALTEGNHFQIVIGEKARIMITQSFIYL